MDPDTGLIDLRSDTVTKPTAAMRRAMYEVEVCDDTYDGDPIVTRLQELAAEKAGTEAALLLVSGTMGNLMGALINTHPGQEAIIGDRAHNLLWEQGGIARVAGLVTRTIPFRNGWIDPADVEAVVRMPTREAASTGLVCMENTSAYGGGLVIPPEHMAKITAVARRHGFNVHLDGARFFNAVVASGRPARDFTQHVDTLSFCLSKGLGAPFGAMFCCRREHIERALAYRQMLGAGMRQIGIMAAAGLVALETGIERMAEDHANAKKLAAGMQERFPGCLDQSVVETNMFFVKVARFGLSGQQLAALLRREGIVVFAGDPRMRFTTHNMITAEDIDATLAVFDRLRAAGEIKP